MDYRKLFSDIGQRPGLFGLDGSFDQYVAFIEGANAGNDWQLLTGFRELLVVRFGDGNNLHWRGLVLQIAFPEWDSGISDRLGDPDVNSRAVKALFKYLDEFLELRDRYEGVAGIFAEYVDLRRSKAW